MTNTTDREPGWLPDPNDEDVMRWWDGTRWTGHALDRDTGRPIAAPLPPRPAEPIPVKLTNESRVERNAMNEWQKFLTVIVLIGVLFWIISAINGVK